MFLCDYRAYYYKNASLRLIERRPAPLWRSFFLAAMQLSRLYLLTYLLVKLIKHSLRFERRTHQAKSRIIVRSLNVGEVRRDEQFLVFTRVYNEYIKQNSVAFKPIKSASSSEHCDFYFCAIQIHLLTYLLTYLLSSLEHRLNSSTKASHSYYLSFYSGHVLS